MSEMLVRILAKTPHMNPVGQQGMEVRGAVAGEAAWELCDRLLPGATSTQTLSSADLAKHIVYWLEQGHLEDLAQRGNMSD